MTDDTQAPSEPFDLDKLKELIELMEKHDLTEVQLRNGPEQWKLRRGGHDTVLVPQAVAPAVAAAPVQAAAAAPAESALPVIKSPIVGTFYSAPSPDDPPFVKPGSSIQEGAAVCIIEAMKVYNQVEADISGVIDEVLVKDGDPVESGQPLFRVRPN